MPTPETLHLITLGENEATTTPLLELLQQRGEQIRHLHLSHPKELQSTLKQQPWDLLLLTSLEPSVIKATQQLLARLRPEVAMMGVQPAGDEGRDQALFELGIQQLIDLKYPQRAVTSLLRDVERIRIYRALLQSQRRLQLIGQQTQREASEGQIPVLFIRGGKVVYSNSLAVEDLGYQADKQLLNMPIKQLVSEEFQESMEQVLQQHSRDPSSSEELELDLLHQDGSLITTKLRLSSAIYKGVLVQQLHCKTQHKSEGLIQQLREQSRRDQATGTYTRTYFVQNLTRWLSQRKPSGALLLLSPDKAESAPPSTPKEREHALSKLAEMVRNQIPDKQLLARYDDDTLILLIMGGDQHRSEAKAERLIELSPQNLPSEKGPATLSIGMTLLTSKNTDHLDLLSQLESTLSEAVSKGGNGLSVYRPAQEELEIEEQVSRLAQEIKLSLQHNTLELFYQPIISLKGDPNESYEVLLRMPHGADYISASEFFDAANQAGLTVAVDRWVVGRAIQSLTTRRRQGQLTRLFVKLSSATLEQVDPFIQWLTNICQTARLEPNTLIIEINEACGESHFSQVRELQQQLNELNIPMALDNVGVNGSYQQFLRHCPVSYLKLSYNLVSQITSEQETRKLTEEITAYAAQQRIQVIANAVEDAYTLSRIYASGVDYILGYFVQAPKASMDFDFTTQF